jgi:hypothetical protein
MRQMDLRSHRGDLQTDVRRGGRRLDLRSGVRFWIRRLGVRDRRPHR